MRFLLILLMILALVTYQAHGQKRLVTRLYIYNSYRDYQIEMAPTNSLQIGSKGKIGYTLIETDLDSLGLKDPAGQTVYLIFEPGTTYYYGYEYQNAAYKEMTPNAFWLSVATLSKYHRHYSITKRTGVIRVE